MPNKTCSLAKVSASVEMTDPFGQQLAWGTRFRLWELQMKDLTFWIIVPKSIFNILPRSFVLRTSGVQWRAWWRRRHLSEEGFQMLVKPDRLFSTSQHMLNINKLTAGLMKTPWHGPKYYRNNYCTANHSTCTKGKGFYFTNVSYICLLSRQH